MEEIRQSMKTLFIVIFVLWALFAGVGLALMAGTDCDDWEDGPEDVNNDQK